MKASLNYEMESQTLEVKMNRRGLEVFIEAAKSTYKNSSGYQKEIASGNVAARSDGWHTHSDFWWPGAEYELTIGTGETDKLAIHAGIGLG